MIKDLNKKIMSLLLSGAMVSSVAPTVANAYGVSDEEVVNYSYVTIEKDVNICRLNGVYTTLANNEPMYVYFGNGVQNLYLEKNSALEVGKANYEHVNIFKKTVLNPTFVQGVSAPSDKLLTVYALSGSDSVYGWERVSSNSLSIDTLIATSIELGEHILKCVDFADYNTNMIGYGNIDINKDGLGNEVVYFGNGKVNTALSKTEAFDFAAKNYGTYYVQSRKVLLPNNYGGQRQVTVYAVSETSYVPGWNRIAKSQVPNNVKVGTTTVYMEAVTSIYASKVTEETIHISTVNQDFVPGISYDYNSMLKKEALDYAYNTYSDFCIMGKAVVNPNTNQKEILYAFSFSDKVPGWMIIGNDFVPENACIYLTMQDAYNREAEILNGYSRVLR